MLYDRKLVTTLAPALLAALPTAAQTARTAIGRAAPMRDTGEAAALKVEHFTLGASDSLSADPRSGGGFVAQPKL